MKIEKHIRIENATNFLLSCLPTDIRTLSELFTQNDKELFLVGGCVRDAFFDITPKDFDVCTNALPDTILSILKNANIKCELRGVDFGVVVAQMNEEIEIATFRSDIDSGSGSNKETKVVLGVSIEDDVKRRDLTINGLFMNLHTNQIIDLVGGVDDLMSGIIRTIGNPFDRFKEDNLRKLRCIRFASRLGFTIHKNTLDAIIADPSLNVSGERIVNELTNAFNKKISAQMLLQNLIDSTLLFEIFKDFTLKSDDEIFMDVFKCSTLNTFLTSFIVFSDDLDKKLVDAKFSSHTALSVKFLSVLDVALFHGDIIDPTWFTSKIKSTDLTLDEIVGFFPGSRKLLTWLFNFKHEEGLSEKLMTQGFKGKDLGDKLKEIAIERMQTEIL